MDEEAPPAWFSEMRQGDWKVGDEVVVTLGECMIGGHHGTEEYGARGIILGLEGAGSPDPQTHPLWIVFRHPLEGSLGSGQGRNSWWYAPGELRRFNALEYAREATSLQSRRGL